jgi:hypothetical protein
MRQDSLVCKRGGQSAGRGLLRRALWVMGRLRSGAPLKATLLACEFEVSLRTAYRDDTRDAATCMFSSANTAVGGGAIQNERIWSAGQPQLLDCHDV